MPATPSKTPPHRVGKLLIALLLFGCALGLAWLAVGQWQSESSRDALSSLRADSARLHQLDIVLMQVLDAESSARGYMITNNPVYLTPYQDGRAEIEATIAALRADGEFDAGQRALIERLPLLIEARWTSLAQGIETGVIPNAGSLHGGVGKQLTDEIRELIDTLSRQILASADRRLVDSFSRFDRVTGMNKVLAAGVLTLLGVLVIVMYRQVLLREELAEVLRTENERLQAEVDARTAELTSLATYLTNAREAEKARLARELHDELGALMTAAKLNAGWIARKLPAETMAPVRERFDRLFETLNEGIAIKRKVVANLRPPLLAELGLIEALRSLADSGEPGELGGHIEVDVPDRLPDLPSDVALALFRIAQEALTNARRHAGASNARVALRVDDRSIVLRVEDNGAGFEPAKLDNGGHGLAGMAHRVQMMAGRFRVSSAPGQGTVIEAQVPLSGPR